MVIVKGGYLLLTMDTMGVEYVQGGRVFKW
jgi:hypothetical protein